MPWSWCKNRYDADCAKAFLMPSMQALKSSRVLFRFQLTFFIKPNNHSFPLCGNVPVYLSGRVCYKTSFGHIICCWLTTGSGRVGRVQYKKKKPQLHSHYSCFLEKGTRITLWGEKHSEILPAFKNIPAEEVCSLSITMTNVCWLSRFKQISSGMCVWFHSQKLRHFLFFCCESSSLRSRFLLMLLTKRSLNQALVIHLTVLSLSLTHPDTGEVFDYLVAHGRMKEKEARAKFRQVRLSLCMSEKKNPLLWVFTSSECFK